MDQTQLQQSQLQQLQHLAAVMPFVILIGLIVVVVPYWFIWKKAGFSPWFSLIMFIPFINLIMLYVLAFSEWKVVPVSRSAATYPYPYPPSSTPPQV